MGDLNTSSVVVSMVKTLRVAVVGASLGGLSAANVLQLLGARVEVYEVFKHGFHLRGGALGNVNVDLVKQIRFGANARSQCLGSSHIKGHGHFYGDLWKHFYDGLPESSVHFGVDVRHIYEPDSTTPQLLVDGKKRVFDLIIGADGGKSTVRKFVTDKRPTYSGYTLWRGLCPAKGIDGPPSGSAQLNGFEYQTLGFPVVCAKGTLWNCGVYMAMPEADVEKPNRNRQVKPGMKNVPKWFVPFVKKMFGTRNAKFWDECSQKGKVSPHAVWEFAADRVVNGRVVLLGDAAHMASPRTGAGAYAAMEDAVMLGQAMQQGGSIDQALAIYNTNTVHRSAELYRSSRRAASYFAPQHLTPVSPALLL